MLYFAFPSWYPLPSGTKDSDDLGGTIQGRITCKYPALQTFPKGRKRYEPNLLTYAQSRYSNGSLIMFDLSQIELRVAAVLSGDSFLAKAYQNNLDLHRDAAIEMFGSEILKHPNFEKVYRHAGKTKNFSDLNLSSAATMRDACLADTGQDIPLHIFEQAVSNRETQRPGLWKWQQRMIQEACTNKILVLPFTGHSRNFSGPPDLIKSHKSEIVNFPIQTMAAITLQDIAIKYEKIALDRGLTRSLQILNIYDASVLDSPADEEAAATQAFEDAVRLCEQSGYWSMICKWTGTTIPLKFGKELLTLKEAEPIDLTSLGQSLTTTPVLPASPGKSVTKTKKPRKKQLSNTSETDTLFSKSPSNSISLSATSEKSQPNTI